MLDKRIRKAALAYADTQHPPTPEARLVLSAAFVAGYLHAISSAEATQEQPQATYVEETAFDEAWSLYQRKDNKFSARKAWKKLTDAEKRQALAHIPGYVLAHPDKQYRPMLATYLNQKRFLDEELITNANEQPTATPESNYILEQEDFFRRLDTQRKSHS